MKQADDQHDVSTDKVRGSPEFWDFCEHCGVLLVESPPYWPGVKGKVERGVGYLPAVAQDDPSPKSLFTSVRESVEVGVVQHMA